MAIVPRNPADQIQFYTTHLPVWSADPAAIGLTSAITEDLDARLAAAKAAHREALALRDAAEAATLRYRESVRELHRAGGAAIATIKAFVSVSGDDSIYARAWIDPPSTSRTPQPLPGAPSISSATVHSSGTLHLAWTAAHGERVGPSSGVYFEIFRTRAGLGETTATLIGTASGLDFRDADIGPGQNIYSIRPRRGRQIGPASPGVVVTLPTTPLPPHATLAPTTTTAAGQGRTRRAA